MKPSSLYDSLQVGDRVMLVSTTDPYTDLPCGTRGSVVAPTTFSDGGRLGVYDRSDADHPVLVKEIDDYRVVSVRWDNGSWLMLVPEAGDSLRPLTEEELASETDVPDVHRPIEKHESFPTAKGILPADKPFSPPMARRIVRPGMVPTEADKASAMLGALTGHKEGS